MGQIFGKHRNLEKSKNKQVIGLGLRFVKDDVHNLRSRTRFVNDISESYQRKNQLAAGINSVLIAFEFH